MVKKTNSTPVRFLIVGGINTALDFGLLFLFKNFGLPAVVANIFSTTIAFVFSFFANKRYTFESNSKNILREMVLFTVVTLFGLWIIQTIIIWLLQPWLMSNLAMSTDTAVFTAKLVATGASMTWNYIFYKYLVFKKDNSNPEIE